MSTVRTRCEADAGDEKSNVSKGTNRTLTVAAECLKPFLLSRSLAGRLTNGEAFLNATIKAWDWWE
jgi:hypothetical protein